MTTEAFICDAIRTPFGRYGGALASIRADDLGAVPLKALMARNPKVDWQAVTDADTLTVTAFSLTPVVQDIALGSFCEQPCPSTSSTAGRRSRRTGGERPGEGSPSPSRHRETCFSARRRNPDRHRWKHGPPFVASCSDRPGPEHDRHGQRPRYP